MKTNDQWKAVSAEKEVAIGIDNFGDLKEKILKVRELLMVERERMLTKLAVANEALLKINGGKR